MQGRKIVRRGFTALVALLCTASVAYAIHANAEAAKAERASARAAQWERYARESLAHRKRTAHSLELLIRRYNRLARSATVEQRHLLAALHTARRRAASARPSGASAPVVYQTTQSIAVSPIAQPAAPAAPAAPSAPTTKTS
jgi:hypothetical protein